MEEKEIPQVERHFSLFEKIILVLWFISLVIFPILIIAGVWTNFSDLLLKALISDCILMLATRFLGWMFFEVKTKQPIN